MEKYEGKPIVGKIAVGKLFFYEKKKFAVKKEQIKDVQAELTRFAAAREEAAAQLTQLYEKTVKETGEKEAALFEVHRMILDGDEFSGAIQRTIEKEKVCAEYAVMKTGESLAARFAEMDDAYMRERAADLRDISERVCRILGGCKDGLGDPGEPVILVAEDLSPSETVQMDKSRLLGLVTEQGSACSHTAILARTMDIPALVGVKIQKEWHGRMAILDGCGGKLTVDPEPEQLTLARQYLQKEQEKSAFLKTLKGKKTVTRDGREIRLYANIGNVEDARLAAENDAEGIGLFRSEFLYLGADHFPTEEEQFLAYKAVVQTMAPKKVIIRTLDIGADKQADYFELDQEVNPALGLRAIRLCLTRPRIFRTQLRALLRASIYGNLSILFPMIISVKEIREVKEILTSVKSELSEQGTPYRDVEIGVMIETPAAVMIAGELATEVDFFSIGTNDLTQYTLAVDRQNPKLDEFYDPHHPAVLRMIRNTVEDGHAGGAWVGICGELGADMTLTETFVKMGVDELSVSPAALLPLRKHIRDMDLS